MNKVQISITIDQESKLYLDRLKEKYGTTASYYINRLIKEDDKKNA